jgi:hypothetical protein
VVLACAIAAALGFLGADAFSDVNGERMAALAAGGLLAMLTNSLIPFAYERGPKRRASRPSSGSAFPSSALDWRHRVRGARRVQATTFVDGLVGGVLRRFAAGAR